MNFKNLTMSKASRGYSLKDNSRISSEVDSFKEIFSIPESEIDKVDEIEGVMRQRIDKLLGVSAIKNHKTLIIIIVR